MASTLYRPRDGQGSLNEHFLRNPQFLLRTFTPNSHGHTTPTRVQSAAAVHGLSTDDILGRDNQETRCMLKHHITWSNRKTDNFISWTSSIVFALQHAIRKANGGRGCPIEDPSTINIIILDTSRLPRQVFLSTVALLEVFDLTTDRDINLPYCYGEYLSQGLLDLPEGSMVTTTLKRLNELSLDSLYSPFTFRIRRSHLWLAVNNVRQKFKKDSKEVPTSEEIELAQRIATSITNKKRFRSVIMMLLLSMAPRDCPDSKIMEAFAANGWGAWTNKANIDSFATTSDEVPEHKQFVQLMHDVQAQAQRHSQTQRAKKDTTSDLYSLTAQVAKLQITKTDPCNVEKVVFSK